MKNLFKLVYLILITSVQLHAQSFTSSNLPIIIINTDGNVQIPDSPKIPGSMKIIFTNGGQRNYVSSQNDPAALNYNGRIAIEIRGSSSQALEKKQYSLATVLADNSTNNNVSLLGMPKEHDWVLNGLAFDPSLIRDYLSYTLSRKIGDYAPRTEYCEVIINDEYRGIYILQEKIKADGNRVDVIKITTTDNTLPDLSGGYITKSDKVAGTDVSAWTMPTNLGNTVDFIHSLPKPSEVTPQQNNYIRSRFEKLSMAAFNASVVDGFPSVIDVPSFVDFMLLNELAANPDAYQFSTFFHKDKNGKLRAGPLWDFNLTYGNDLFLWGFDRSKTDGWQFSNGDNNGAKFWNDLFDNPTFKCYLSKRWNELTQSGAPLHADSIKALIDKTVAIIKEANLRDSTLWPLTTNYNPPTQRNLAANITLVKTFLDARMAWITTNLGSFSDCSNVQTPPLVITRINYQPDSTSTFPDSKDQEFIEILNNGNDPVNTSGFYFSGTGFVYQFPNNFNFPPHAVLQLANKHEVFLQRYGFSAFGSFTRNLSNNGKKLKLVDGYGNVIDEVEYSSQAPWPDAGGNGKYIKLISPDLDNNVGSNWEASTEPIATTVTGIEEHAAYEILMYPNPVDSILRITSSDVISSLQLRDIQGRLLETYQVGSNSVTLNLNHISAGMYLMSIVTNGKTVIQKVVKK